MQTYGGIAKGIFRNWTVSPEVVPINVPPSSCIFGEPSLVVRIVGGAQQPVVIAYEANHKTKGATKLEELMAGMGHMKRRCR